MILYSDLHQLNNAGPCSGGGFLLPCGGVRKFLWGSPRDPGKRKYPGEESHGRCPAASVSVPRAPSSFSPGGGIMSLRLLYCLLVPHPGALPTCSGKAILGSLGSSASQGVGMFPGTQTSAGLPARALGFPGICSYWRNTLDLYKVIAGQPNLLTWSDPGVQAVSAQWSTSLTPHIYCRGPCGRNQRSSGPQLVPGTCYLCHCSSAQAELIPSVSSWDPPVILHTGRNFSSEPAPLLRWAKFPQRSLRAHLEPAPEVFLLGGN